MVQSNPPIVRSNSQLSVAGPVTWRDGRLGAAAKKARAAKTNNSDITLVVEGRCRKIPKSTAKRIPLIAELMEECSEQGSFRFDRNAATFFNYLLDCVRPGNKLPSGLTRPQLRRIKQEARFFKCNEVLDEIEHIYPKRQKVSKLKPKGGPLAAQAYRELAVVLATYRSIEYGLEKLRHADAIDFNLAANLPFYQLWTTKKPEDAIAWQALGECYEATENAAESAAAFDTAARLERSGKALLGRAEAYLLLERYDDAQESFTQALMHATETASPNVFKGACSFGLAKVALHALQLDEARQHLVAACQVSPENGDYFAERAAVEEKLGDFTAAVASYMEAISHDGGRHEWYAKVGNIKTGEHDWPEAEVAFKRAAELQPAQAQYWSRLALAQRNQQKYAEAETAYSQLVSLDPANATYHYRLGDSRYSQNKYAEAETAYLKAISLEPNNHIYHNTLGNSLYNQAKYAAAEAAYFQAVTLDSTVALFQNNLGQAQLHLEKYVAAETSFSQAASLEPANGTFYRNLGLARMLQSKYATAETSFSQAASLEPTNANSYLSLGMAQLLQEKYAAAETTYLQAVALDPTRASTHNDLSCSQYGQRKYAAAEAASLKAVEFDSNYALYHHNLARALHAQKKYEAAEAAYSQSAALEPANSVYRDELAKIRSKNARRSNRFFRTWWS